MRSGRISQKVSFDVFLDTMATSTAPVEPPVNIIRPIDINVFDAIWRGQRVCVKLIWSKTYRNEFEFRPPHYLHVEPWGKATLIVMKLLERMPKLLTASDCNRLLLQIGAQLFHLHHELNRVHGDIKMENIMYDGERAMLIDYGNCQKLGARIGKDYGTRQYCSIAAHQARLRYSSDYISLCYSVIEDLGNDLPWDDDYDKDSISRNKVIRLKKEGLAREHITCENIELREVCYKLLDFLAFAEASVRASPTELASVFNELVAQTVGQSGTSSRVV